jgi:hypothetical protein
MKIITCIPFAKREWTIPSIPHDDPDWKGFYFEEFVIDWSIFPENSFGKLYVETRHIDIPESTDGFRKRINEGGWIRMAYQYEPRQTRTVEGSTIETYAKKVTRWQLLESEWFKLPTEPDVACVCYFSCRGSGG